MIGPRDRIITTSMVSDTLPNVERWVRRTLSTGVDHMIVFLDDDRPDVQAALAAHPMVSVVRTDAAYWNHARPVGLPDRQRVDANLALRALVDVPSAGWLFHIDVDEALAFDRERFVALDARAIRFRTLEAVAERTWPDNEPSLFKKIPSAEDLHALAALGVIDTPDMDIYFRGHYQGKVGVRPHRDVRFRVHSVYELPDTKIPTVEPPDMHLLHYASYSVVDFVDRWMTFDPAQAAGRPFRNQHLGTAFHTVRHHPSLPDDVREQLITEIFDRYIADDVPALREFGLLVENPLRPVEPRPLPEEDIDRLEAELAALQRVDKQPFTSGTLRVRRHTIGSR